MAFVERLAGSIQVGDPSPIVFYKKTNYPRETSKTLCRVFQAIAPAGARGQHRTRNSRAQSGG